MRTAFVVLSLAIAGCAPQIGDSCDTALDCSLTGDRACDTSTPNGECTLFGCEPGTCPDEGVCVRFRPNDSRLQFTACMKRCTEPGNCRVDDGYECRSAESITDPTTEEVLAELTAGEEPTNFCVASDPNVD